MTITQNYHNNQIDIRIETTNKNDLFVISFKNNIVQDLYLSKENFYELIIIIDSFIESREISNMCFKDSKNNMITFCKPNDKILILSNDDKKEYLNREQIKKLRLYSIESFSHYYLNHDIADLIDKNNNTANNIIIEMWKNLDKNNQKINFGYACDKGNLDLVEKIYRHSENKFLNEIFCSFEEYGLQMSMQPEAKKILKFFKQVMTGKKMTLSYDMKKWITDNKLGRKIKVS